MYVECPNCNKEIEVTDHLPERACDESEIECSTCKTMIEIGWYATAEVRSHKVPNVLVTSKPHDGT
jgi:hypothetical protein